MCTVTFLPLPHNSFIITSNRDERKSRATVPPQQYLYKNVAVFFPKDEEAGGTWFAVSKEYTAVLLNGAAISHQRTPPYRMSRGLVMLDFFEYMNPTLFSDNYNFTNIEPFTLVLVQHANNQLFQFRWDGDRPSLVEMDSKQPQIWSSATLYNEIIRERRRSWFAQWVQQNTEYTVENILRFHRFGGDGDTNNDLVMNRNGVVQTVSITSFEKMTTEYALWYDDLVKKERNRLTLSF